MRERRRREWLISLRKEPDKAGRPQSRCPFGLLEKSGAHFVALLGIVDQATTFVVAL